MIPAEIATRLQLLLAEELRAVDHIRPLPTDLPQMDRGDRFTARILNALPDGTYRALVAGNQITLALPEGAKSGDVLELVVTGRQAQSITAQLAPTTTTSPGTVSSAPSHISQTGQLISQLLTGRHSAAQEPLPLNAGRPLAEAPPQSAADILPALRNAVTQSGLFYEAHQAQWVAGKLLTVALLQEPQAQTPPLPTSEAPTAQAATTAPLRQGIPPEAHADAPANRTSQQTNAPPAGPQREGPEGNDAIETQRPHARIAESLTPLVHQQLDTLATHQMAWQGLAWPGQMMHWEIQDPAPESGGESRGDGDEEEAVWQSTLRLQMPMLGDLEARLVVTAAGVAVRLDANSAESVDKLQAGETRLQDALAAAGITLTGFMVAQDANT